MSFFDNIFEMQNKKKISGLTKELKCLYIYKKFQKEKKTIIFVTSNLNDAGRYYTSLIPHTNNVWFFPMDDFLTSQALAISPDFQTSRLDTINHILNKEKGIIITNLMGYLRFLPPKENFKKIILKVNQETNLKTLTQKLLKIGYKRQTTVNMTGEIAVRGFILDIFPIGYTEPIRIEFWGDVIENIKIFNIDTQRTKKQINNLHIYPNTEFLVDKAPFDTPYRDIYKYTKVKSILDYPDSAIVVYDDYTILKNNYNHLLEEMNNYTLSSNLDKKTKYMHKFEDLKPKNTIIIDDLDNKSYNFHTKEITLFPKKLNDIEKKLNNYLKTGKIIVLCLDSRYQINHLIETLNIPSIYTNENKLFTSKLNLIVKKISQGFETEKYIVLTPFELYGKQGENNYKTNFKYGTKIKDITKLEKGDYVVHISHGIGRYLGIKTVPKNNLKKDYLMIEYRDNDKLYIPVEKLELINKYTGKEGAIVKLNKLGGHEWEKTKAKARKRAEDIAGDLLELYTKREAKCGFAFPKDTEKQDIFEQEFEYEETPDQLRVTKEIKKDMESTKPMDRLLCGDVGFGKTEVAFRAIFKCIMGGKQAAILCPTTILSSQHFQNSKTRYKSFPINIAILNRFVSVKKIKSTLLELKEGKIDLLIGTHRILSEDVIFKNLGLLVVDEEQRFGVKQKEKIKKYKNNIDVLTLSATPIPRTLQMSMAGIRSLSLIETPPAQRYPIQTYVLPESDQMIKEAIQKEKMRGGQAFILFNRVENIETKRIYLSSLISDVKIAVAHGQMNKYQLEKVMLDFINKKYDVLLCTTIIETGIDIPSVNTLIVIDSDRFGLSQLYQIRGRIGRSDKIAYCYLMYNSHKTLSDVANKRLKVIKDFTELGSGFSIAMRDLSIRGAGDILGKEQAGFIDSVGVELFMEILNEEVNKLKGNEIKQEETPQPLIEVETYISDDYVSDEELKIEIHKKINTIDSYEQLLKVKNELEDRFGTVSEELIIYMYEEWFEKEAKTLNITNIKQTKNSIAITLNKDLIDHIDGETLFYKISSLSRMFRLQNKNDFLIITLNTVKLEKHFIYYLLDLIKIIKKSIIKV